MKKFLILTFLVINSLASAKTYFISPTGNDATGNGTISAPWFTLDHIWELEILVPGDTVYMRGGIYYNTLPNGNRLYEIHGTKSNMICILNYPNEWPIFDYTYQTASDYLFGLRINNTSYVKIKGLEIRNINNGPVGEYMAVCQILNSNYVVFEHIIGHNTGNQGYECANNDSIYFINCDEYNHFGGNNGDGWQMSNYLAGGGQRGVYILKGCRAWNCDDDGFDNYWNDGIVEYDSCWAFSNGRLFETGGNGFKLGYTPAASDGRIQRVLTHCIAAFNDIIGFCDNNADVRIHYYNNLAYHNGYNAVGASSGMGWGFWSTNTHQDWEVYRNNISYANYNAAITAYSEIDDQYNSWNTIPGVALTDADFENLTEGQLSGARQADGSLPNITFGRLVAGSDCIDAGINIGFSFNGSAPDLGWSEASSGSATPAAPVYVSSVIENATPSRLEMTYNLNLANVVPASSAFSVLVNSSARTVSAVAISGTKVLLTLANPVVFGDAVTVAYIKPASNPIQTVAGGQAASITAQNVTNNVAAVNPIYVSSVIENATPSRLEVTYNLNLANVVPASSAFSVLVNSSARTVSAVAISGTKVLLTLANPVVFGDAVTVAYIKPASNPIQTVAGGQAASITAQNVTNNVAAAVNPIYVSSVIENATPSRLEVTYNLNLANVVPASSAFSVWVNSSARTVSAVAISGTKVLLTLANPVVFGDAVTVAYIKPASNPIQTVAGGQAASITAQNVTNNVAAG